MDDRSAAASERMTVESSPLWTSERTPLLAATPVEMQEKEGEQDPPAARVPVRKLFAFANRGDIALMVIGSIGAVIAGLQQPVQFLLMGNMFDVMNPHAEQSEDVTHRQINRVALQFAIIGVVALVSCFLHGACWSIAAARQIERIRSAYVRALLQMEIGWYDVNDPGKLASHVVESTVAMQSGIGTKMGDSIQFACVGLGGLAIGLVKGWQLTVLLLAFMPFIVVAFVIAIKSYAKETQLRLGSHAQAGAIAEEAIQHIRTVHMFNAIERFVDKYATALAPSTKAGIQMGLTSAWSTGLSFFFMYCAYACGMYFGAWKIADDGLDCVGPDCWTGGRIVAIFTCIIMGSMSIAQAGPSIEAITAARVAARDVFGMIERRPYIDPAKGIVLEQVAGTLELSHIYFAYPSRPSAPVCRDYGLTIRAGETVALVGPSGSGKSTIVALLERYYDPQAGTVLLDGVDIRSLNVRWLRQQIGLVSQEPTLFATSVLENIRFGCPDATDAQVEAAAKAANAYDFIQSFPQGFLTEVGERGVQLSGGQKQRVAIARAILKNPPVLILDEATSALDAENERIVQASLDQLVATSKRTTLIIAHRLSTIRNADRIAVHQDGAIVELGSHDELMQIEEGIYRKLVLAQQQSSEGGDAGAISVPAPAPELAPDIAGLYNGNGHVSATSDKSKDTTELLPQEDTEPTVAHPTLRLWELSMPEWKMLVLGAVSAIVNAAAFPIWGVVETKMTVLFYKTESKDAMLTEALYWSLAYLVLGVVFASAMTLEFYAFSVASYKLAARLRQQAFRAILRQEMAWFDHPANTSGAITTRVAGDTATLQSSVSDTLFVGIVNNVAFSIGFMIAFSYSWEMTLLLVVTSPALIFSNIVMAQMMDNAGRKAIENDADGSAGVMLSEAVGAIRTVAALNIEEHVHATFSAWLRVSRKLDYKTGILSGAAFAIAQACMAWTLSLLFYMGGRWILAGRLTFEAMLMVIMVIVYSTVGAGIAAQVMTGQVNATTAANRLFSLIDREPSIDATSKQGQRPAQLKGDLAFQHVDFAYPSRPDSSIFREYDLQVSAGQTVALVGASGSGKSTAIALLERFYDPSAGRVSLDGQDLRHLQVAWLRDRISLVSQEPVLFAGTIADNIALGKPDATRAEIEDAARQADALDFIRAFPEGLDTDVGDRGVQVSGGQKQRIAIARAIVRDPAVLLLDEATSALDAESERVVQASLDRLLAKRSRTTIIVAHRLSTIRHADVIAVVQDGRIVEQGTHAQLMAIPGGTYQALVASQMG